jgi:hypothetical protein
MIGADLQWLAGHEASHERTTTFGQCLPGDEWQNVGLGHASDGSLNTDRTTMADRLGSVSYETLLDLSKVDRLASISPI